MCNIAGYAGTKPAAPILLEMLKKQEGLDSGYYTGITTIHEGKIYYAKVVGNIDTLLKQTDAASLPGTIGIAHSRTPGGQEEGKEWGHPFTTERDGNVLLSLVLNGWPGYWTPNTPQYQEDGKALIAEGYTLKSTLYAPEKPRSIEGITRIHNSDIFTQRTAKFIDQGYDASTALWKTYAFMPKEVATLALSVTEPDAIVWGRTNFPMFRASMPDGMYLATSPMALPEEATAHELLPAASTGLVYKDRYTCMPFAKELRDLVGPITPEIVSTAYNWICEALRQERRTINYLYRNLNTELGKGACTQAMPLVYDTIWELHKQGRLIIERETVPGMTPELTAPKLFLRLQD